MASPLELLPRCICHAQMGAPWFQGPGAAAPPAPLRAGPDAAKQKATETAQYTKEAAVAGKDKTGGVLQQTTETVKGAVVGAKDAVVNTLGMGGDNTNTKDSSSITEKI